MIACGKVDARRTTEPGSASRALRHIALLGLVAAVLGACTGEREQPPPPPADTNNAQIADGLAQLWAGDNPTAEDTSAADCFADAFSSRVSPEKLRETGIIDGSGAVVAALPVLDPELAGTWVDAQFTCVDYVEESARALATQTRGAVDATTYATCLGQEVTDAQVRSALVAGLSGDPDNSALDVLSQAQLRCAREAE